MIHSSVAVPLGKNMIKLCWHLSTKIVNSTFFSCKRGLAFFQSFYIHVKFTSNKLKQKAVSNNFSFFFFFSPGWVPSYGICLWTLSLFYNRLVSYRLSVYIQSYLLLWCKWLKLLSLFWSCVVSYANKATKINWD